MFDPEIYRTRSPACTNPTGETNTNININDDGRGKMGELQVEVEEVVC